MEHEIKSLNDVLAIAKRRKWTLVVPTVSIFLVAAVIAFLLPSIYSSTSTILIEEQEVPREYVNTTVTSFADQRLQSINQRIMGTSKLLDIIGKFNLYADLKNKWTTEEIVAKMRKDIKFNTISADVIDPRSGQPRPATIAFSLSYQGKNPSVVQQVANELTTLYLNENLKVREKQSLGTTTFIEEEMKGVQKQLEDIEGKIAAYKQRNINALPELAQVNMQAVETTDREIMSLNSQLGNLRERESYLQAQLASMPTDSASQDKTRLNELRVRMVDLKTRFTDEHPDVIKVKGEIAELVKQLRSSGRDTADSKPDNPAYVTLSSQLASIKSEIASTKRQIDSFIRKRDSYRQRVAATPGVEEGYKNLVVERNNLQSKYDDLSKKYMEAKVAHGLEQEQKGERFTLIDSARLPEKPISPNIPAILLIGLVLGIGSGVGLTALREQSDQTFRTAEALSRVTSFPVLATIPEIGNGAEAPRGFGRRGMFAVGLVGVLVATTLVVHFFIMDLDIVWAKMLRNVARMG
ncbi:GumC family protein [Geobacter pickeringii]|uniref:Chain-length determining protein n=1 Tax=Geobacter pickeringii TaxID=345632 RepID=A0A0B5BFE9_9BACT|nr:chain-length determining protein [Geobacter pickeringii]AJE03260.1 chain-length determining protein [Geobacter pickeringii]